MRLDSKYWGMKTGCNCYKYQFFFHLWGQRIGLYNQYEMAHYTMHLPLISLSLGLPIFYPWIFLKVLPVEVDIQSWFPRFTIRKFHLQMSYGNLYPALNGKSFNTFKTDKIQTFSFLTILSRTPTDSTKHQTAFCLTQTCMLPLIKYVNTH